LLAGKPQ